ncbi:sensor histidine kinase [Nocardiopsis lambiniae]|uniref:histidine kinase n=1 Tax=Nocardiopsis lambiniae TaxID=3075539 RepID=A0ABU2M881_9ACTN|nr:nitrate- and nitrite sensing domain-containing protein [Nocardiopsis sp. DSM 44743]MDT0328878.1 nitrate- and nitrite sensing domain-containing protein [Nocardiopsis sp. DSM 44743]
MRRTRVKASTIRGQLNRIVLVPSLCFLALWLIVAAVGTVQAVHLMGVVAQAREGTEVFSAAVLELRAERRLSLTHLGRTEAGATVDPDEPRAQRERTDTAVTAALDLAEHLRGTRDDEVRRSADAFITSVEEVAALRTVLDDGSAVQEQLLIGYGRVIDDATAVSTALVHTTDGGDNLTDAVLTSELLGAAEEYSTADALFAGVIARGGMGYEETAHFTYLTASYRDTLGRTADVLSPEVRSLQEEMTATEEWARAEEISRQVVTRPPGSSPSPQRNAVVDVDAARWDESSGDSVALMDDLARAQSDRTVDLAWNAALAQVALGVAAALLSLVGGVIAISAIGRSSRRLTDRLTLLRERVMERDDDLPDIVDRAQRGARVDAYEELPPLDGFGDDEIGQVAEAFDSAQLTAVEAAVRQAEIRRGANKAFLGIAFRNQNLVQRQLRLLDEIEYDEQDPEALGRLFRLDHLTTRARRYADNLIILGGGQSARRWRQPRPLVDVLRAAIAETEDFERVRLTSAPRVLMHGQAVADIVHLLAELIENATQFSPAGAPVDVGCGPCPDGLLVEVEDRGLGMSEHGYEQARRTLARPPEFDVMALPDDPRLGLFVVARLAERHGVRVWLEPSPYGGTRAITLIPRGLLEPAEIPMAAGPRGVVPARAEVPPERPAARPAPAAEPAEPGLVDDVRRAFGILPADAPVEDDLFTAPPMTLDAPPGDAGGRSATGAHGVFDGRPDGGGPQAVHPDGAFAEGDRGAGPRPIADGSHTGAHGVFDPRSAAFGADDPFGGVPEPGPRPIAGRETRVTGPQAAFDVHSGRTVEGHGTGPHAMVGPGEPDPPGDPARAFDAHPDEEGERRRVPGEPGVPAHRTDPPASAQEPPWDVRWGHTGPQAILDPGAVRGHPTGHADAGGPRPVPDLRAPHGAPDGPVGPWNGHPGEPTEPLPHLATDRPDPWADPFAGERSTNGREGGHPAPRRDLPPGFTGPRPVPPGRERPGGPVGRHGEGAPTAPFALPDGARPAGRPEAADQRGAPPPLPAEQRSTGPQDVRPGDDHLSDSGRLPLPKRPGPGERGVPRVPAPTPPGGHSEP